MSVKQRAGSVTRASKGKLHLPGLNQPPLYTLIGLTSREISSFLSKQAGALYLLCINAAGCSSLAFRAICVQDHRWQSQLWACSTQAANLPNPVRPWPTMKLFRNIRLVFSRHWGQERGKEKREEIACRLAETLHIDLIVPERTWIA